MFDNVPVSWEGVGYGWGELKSSYNQFFVTLQSSAYPQCPAHWVLDTRHLILFRTNSLHKSVNTCASVNSNECHLTLREARVKTGKAAVECS